MIGYNRVVFRWILNHYIERPIEPLCCYVHDSEAKSTSSQYSLHGEDPFTTTLFRPKIAAGGNE